MQRALPPASPEPTATAAASADPVQLAADYAAVRAAAAVLQYRVAAGHLKPARR